MKYLLILLFITLSAVLYSQEELRTETGNKYGLITAERSQPGFVLFAPLFSKESFLIDKCGGVVNSWKSRYNPGQSVYLLPDGELLRTGNDSSRFFYGGGGVIQRFSWDNKLLWQYKISDSLQRQHHDICPLANGNILVLLWEYIPAEQGISRGRDSLQVGKCIWSEKIIELQPQKDNSAAIVWEWRIWDHLIQDRDPALPAYGVIAEHPELLNINYGVSVSPDWLHFNSIAYNAALDQILISNRNLNEIYVIDHSTSITEASSHTGGRWGKGGDLLFRWGNPAAYNAADESARLLFRQHHAHWIPEGYKDAGKIMVFNNGPGRTDGEYSTVEVLSPQIQNNEFVKVGKVFTPEHATRIYGGKEAPEFFSSNVSSAQQLRNGNIFICEGATGTIFEVNNEGKTVWKFISPVVDTGTIADGVYTEKNTLFRAQFFEPSDITLKGKKLQRKKPMRAGESRGCPNKFSH